MEEPCDELFDSSLQEGRKTWTIHNRYLTVGAASVLFGSTRVLGLLGEPSVRFLPHLDEALFGFEAR